ncbi:hypothetical protein PFLUV_G00026630 [Perca fluviatilis]|uniref:BED-type domain-containing protein n=1 Tax=Perca fluviatilis TaxID=8168 RepID=A0A6A5FRC7_PERFL|nr:hypothetical protein PFLUV_G00026630 [Perca fluviatilis]
MTPTVRGKTSEIWEYFRPTGKRVVCTLCQTSLGNTQELFKTFGAGFSLLHITSGAPKMRSQKRRRQQSSPPSPQLRDKL